MAEFRSNYNQLYEEELLIPQRENINIFLGNIDGFSKTPVHLAYPGAKYGSLHTTQRWANGPSGYSMDQIEVSDLNGDGKYEILLGAPSENYNWHRTFRRKIMHRKVQRPVINI